MLYMVLISPFKTSLTGVLITYMVSFTVRGWNVRNSSSSFVTKDIERLLPLEWRPFWRKVPIDNNREVISGMWKTGYILTTSPSFFLIRTVPFPLTDVVVVAVFTVIGGMGW